MEFRSHSYADLIFSKKSRERSAGAPGRRWEVSRARGNVRRTNPQTGSWDEQAENGISPVKSARGT